MIFYNRIQIAKWTGIFEGINILAGLFLFHLFTRMYGLFIGILIGWPFGRFLAAHPSFYQFVQDVVRGGYVFITVLAFDFLFTYLVYFLLDKLVTRQSTWKDLFGVTWRAVKGLIPYQFIVGILLVLICWRVKSFSLWLIPPFLTSSPISSLYMALWGCSLLLFVCAFALTENRRTALQKAKQLLMSCWRVWGMFVFVSFWLTFLPALFAGWLGLPNWLCLVGGLGAHTLFFMAICFLLFRQDNFFTNC